MKQKFAAIAVATALIFTGASSASASTSDDADLGPGDVTVQYDGPAYIDESATAPRQVSMPSVGSQLTPVNGVAPNCIVCGVPQYKAVKVSGPTLVKKKFVRYLTGAWAKSTGYAWNSSTTVGASITSGLSVTGGTAAGNIGVTSSVTKTYSITINIAASSGKYSKLGLASNYNKYYVKVGLFNNGKHMSGTSWKYGYLHSPTRDQYLIVYYQ